MGFYSFEVFAEGDEVELPEHGILLEPGPNTFNALIKGDVREFVNNLHAQRVRVVRRCRLDVHEPIDAPTVSDAYQLLSGPQVLDGGDEADAVAPAQAGTPGAPRGDRPGDAPEPPADAGDDRLPDGSG